MGFSPAASADGVTVRSGPGSAVDGMFLTYVGCTGFFAPATAPRGTPMAESAAGFVLRPAPLRSAARRAGVHPRSRPTASRYASSSRGHPG